MHSLIDDPAPASLLAAPDRRRELRSIASTARSWDLTPRQICDLELLLNGAFAPLSGFLNRADFDGVCERMRLADGALWPMPITLDVTEEIARSLHPGDPLVLRDPEGVPLAILWMSESWLIDRAAKARAVYGTLDRRHPGVDHLYTRANDWAVAGRVEGLEAPRHYDFLELRQTPAQVRAEFARRGWQRVVAFQTRNPLHRAHYALTLRAARELGAGLLLHPVVGMTKPGDVDHYTRVRCYSAALRHYPENAALLALLPLAMRMGGPREALWHGIIRKNFGCTHIIVGRDHAGPGKDSQGKPFYGPYEAQELFRQHEEELGIRSVPFREMLYVADRGEYLTEDEVPRGATVLSLSGTQLRERLQKGAEIPEWFTFPEVAAELRRTHPPRHEQGFTVFFTGLSGAGKSTLANALRIKLLERGGRPVTLLDGDLVRKNLSSELGFSREHRDLNIRRIAFVAAEITQNGGIALCAPIAPYEVTRREVRQTIEAVGGFVLVHVSTPLEVCEGRDRKGLYAKARAGTIPHFTGVSDPYEAPTDSELAIDTTEINVEEAVERVLDLLAEQGFVARVEPAQS
jgi:sulfate adenylyltransferase